MCLSHQVSRSKANLIEKVNQARQMQNDTFDGNLPATVTSTNSVNLHTEELHEVPISSSFFYKNNALSPLSSTLRLKSAGQANS